MSILAKLLIIKDQLNTVKNIENLKAKGFYLISISIKLVHLEKNYVNELKEISSGYRLLQNLFDEYNFLNLEWYTQSINEAVDRLNQLTDLSKINGFQSGISAKIRILESIHHEVVKIPLKYVTQFNIISRAEKLLADSRFAKTVEEPATPSQAQNDSNSGSITNTETLKRIGHFKDSIQPSIKIEDETKANLGY
ncbi:MAG: hypothetical protein H0T84_05545 [Tatlockia sp.]|nr:hypothetical protein [Tatlockia sp.]